MVFSWENVQMEIRILGTATKLSTEDSDMLFNKYAQLPYLILFSLSDVEKERNSTTLCAVVDRTILTPKARSVEIA